MAPNEPRQDSTRGEQALIARIGAAVTAQPAAAPLFRALPFGDDMAPLAPDGGWLWTTDMLMDGIDFDSTRHNWRDVGWKALAVNLSDCAAMAVRPVAALCAVALHGDLSMTAALELLAGAQDAASEHHCPLVGGDTNSWPQPTVIAVTVAAQPYSGVAPIRRSGAGPGDRLFVTGPLGGSILGRHLRPTPRLRESEVIARRLSPTAMIDISDGLSIDLGRLLDASGCAAELDEALLARATHADARALSERDGQSPLDHVLSDGEDFELLVAIPAHIDPAGAGVPLLPVGHCVAGVGTIDLRTQDGPRRLARRGWEHFR